MATTRRMPNTDRFALGLLLLAGALALPGLALAMPSDPPSLLAASCGVVQTIEGEVQILDESRTTTHEARRNEIVPCGAWISATRGNLGFRHVEGHVVRLSSGAFIQVRARQAGDEAEAGGVVLFKGMLFVKASETGPSLQVVSANGRILFEPGAVGIALWDESQEETQLLGLQGSSVFENRFESGTSVRVAAGEASSLNFKLLRVIPGDPAPMPAANVKLKLAEFHLDYAERERLLAQVEKRSERQILVNLGPVPRATESADEHRSGGLVTRIHEDKEKGRLVLEERVESMDGSEVSRLSPKSEGIAREVSAAAEPEAPGQVLSARRTPATQSSKEGGADASSGEVAASETGAKLNLAKKSEYRTHPEVDDDQASELQRHLVRKLAGDGSTGEELEGLVSPDAYRASSGSAGGGAVDVSEADRASDGARRPAKVSSREEQERRRLLNELSKLKAEP